MALPLDTSMHVGLLVTQEAELTHPDDKPEPGDLPDDAPADLSTNPNDKDDLFLNHLERR